MVTLAGFQVPVKTLYGAVAVVAILAARELLRWGYTARFASPLSPRPLAQLPEEIHLVPAEPIGWRDPTRAEADLEELTEVGYVPAGTWIVPEVPGLSVALLVNVETSLRAAIHDHPRAGTWCEVSYRCADGSSTTFTSARAIGRANRPGHRVDRCAGYSASLLDELAATEPHATPLVPVTVEDAADCFAAAFAEQRVARAA